MPKDELQKELRDELRLTAAIRCYSVLRSGGAKSTSAQHEYMFNLFHGDGSSIPSNIQMLCDGSYIYRSLFDANESEAVTSKSDEANNESRLSLSLKASLTRDNSRKYFAKLDFLPSDLEKKGRNGKQLVSGRNLLDMAKKGTANYRKALSYAVKKFDLDKMDVIESGNSIDDVIEYVRCEMYQHFVKQEAIKKKTIILDGNDELDDNKDLEDEYLSEINNVSSKESNEKKDSNNAKESDIVSKNSKEEKAGHNTIDNDQNKGKEKDNNQVSVESKKIPPKEWFFPGWFSFITFGPFVPKDKRLALFEITDTAKNVGKSRSQKRKADKLEKDAKRVVDDTANRGFTTDQKLQLEIIGLTHQSTNDRSRESRLMGLCVQEQALTNQIDRAERIAERMAPNDMENINNRWWKKVDNLMKQQEAIVVQVACLNNNSIDTIEGGSKDNHGSNLEKSLLTNNSDVSSSNTKQN